MKKLLLLTMAMLLGSMMYAQVTTSGISGKIYGADNATLPGATILVVHTPSGTEYATLTDSEGLYRIPNMKVGGPYKISVTYVGYTTFVKDDITLSLGQALTFNQTLTEEAATISGVVITAGVKNALMDGNRTGASTNINVQQIQNLPSINRSITDFTKLTPQANGNSFGGQDGRYNNITIDGANFNNNFGLSTKALPGGDAQPISLDAIEEINVNIAPYDIRQSNFTGANVNAITRSGDNTWKGSVYSYFRGKSFYGDKVEDQTLSLSDQTFNSYGFRVGGPIIKDKLFIFLNAEKEKSDYPGIPWQPSDPENGIEPDADKSISRTTVQDLSTMHDYLLSTYGYEAGSYQNFGNFASENIKLLGRIDWNINKHHKFTTRYNYVKSTNDAQLSPTSAPGTRSTFGRIGEKSMAYSYANYGLLNTVSSITAELNSSWQSSANKLLFTYTKIQDTRDSDSDPFPFVDIYKDGDPYMSFGYELFSKDNDVVNNVLTFTDNYNYFYGKHTFTVGASFDKMFFGNSYKRYGTSYYRFASMEDFVNGVAPTTFGLTYPYGDGDGYAELNFGYASVYGQDEYQVSDNLKLTAGIRLEMPIYINDLIATPPITALTFNDLDGKPITLDAGTWPKSKVTVSPRFGFNWDATGDKSIQVRGGTGIFTGRLPFVWFTNQPTNSGTLQNTVEITKATDLDSLFFNKDPFYHLTNTSLFPATPSSAAPGSIAVVDKEFKMPQVWRTNLAADFKLPWWNLIMTVEGIYSKDINAVIQYNANQTISDSTFLGPDNRIRFFSSQTGTVPSRRINASVSNAMVLDNTNEGYSYSITVQLAKPITKGFSGMIAYTYSGAKDMTSNPGSAAASAWSSNPAVISQNDPGLSYSKFAVPHRVIGALTYRTEYLNHLGTSVSVFYQGSSQDRLDYIYSNDMNGDGNASDLMYIPKDASEIIFDDITKKLADGTIQTVFTAAEQNDAFWKYVDQDEYLSEHKGEYAERYGVIMPWVSRFDVKILQDIFTKFGATRHTLQISLDLLNVGNLLSSNWGIYRKQSLGSYDITLLKYSKTGSDGIPHYQLNYTGSELPTSTYSPVLSTTSTWGAQLGIRYTF